MSLKSKFRKSEYLKNASTLILGVGAAQLIPVLLQPLLRRIFTPDDFGVLAVYFAIVSTLAVLANFRYNHVVVVADNESEARGALKGGLYISLVFSLLLFFIVFFFENSIISMFDFPAALKGWLYLVPFSVFFISSSLILNSWLTRVKRYKSIAFNKIVRRSSEGLSHISMGLTDVSFGLIIGNFIGDVGNSFYSLFQAIKSDKSVLSASSKEVKHAMKKYVEFPKYNLLPTALDILALFIPVMIVNSYYNSAITGQFDLSRQILALPLALISAALGQVLLQNLSEKSRNSVAILPIIKKNLILLASLSILGLLILVPFGESLFKFIFGEGWGLAGNISSILGFSFALRFIVTPLSMTFIALKKVKIISAWQIGYFTLISFLLFLRHLPIEEFILYYMLLEVLAYFVYLCLILYSAVKHDHLLKKLNL